MARSISPAMMAEPLKVRFITALSASQVSIVSRRFSRRKAAPVTHRQPPDQRGVVGGDESPSGSGPAASIRWVRRRPSVCCAFLPANP
jgi:hypothetical protein